ncbi:hypothetical protein LTR05_007156 [Lithohypha guttulata]|uniref:F-box domain-containing protein n=1 Tax=Lithohypha guttulata TaxID=1690604 RepID=A0AAN7YDP5_9EURO|nr:hypothetical protein LTR05_007156 [Lithohypha guttulata]
MSAFREDVDRAQDHMFNEGQAGRVNDEIKNAGFEEAEDDSKNYAPSIGDGDDSTDDESNDLNDQSRDCEDIETPDYDQDGDETYEAAGSPNMVVGDDYAHFVRSIAQPDMARALEVGIVRPEDEIMLPMYTKDAAFFQTQSANMNECDQDLLEANLSYKAYSITEGNENRRNAIINSDEVWEHIAGPECTNAAGYHGHRISVEEMAGITTAQALCFKIEDEEAMEESDDEAWERDTKWFLSGLGDVMPSRDCSDLTVYPARRGREQVHAENYVFELDSDSINTYAMAFHPACLEVFKRASINKTGTWDATELGEWWKMQGEDQSLWKELPEDEALERGREQWWFHQPGDEWLAANPCLIPKFTKILADCRGPNAVRRSDSRVHRPTSLTALPRELRHNILSHLDTIDIARASLAIPSLHDLAQPILEQRCLAERPYLWELWCKMPYSKWTGTTETELKTTQDSLDRQEEEIKRALEILEEEGHEEAYVACKEFWTASMEDRYRETCGSAWGEKPAFVIDRNLTDFTKLVIELDRVMKRGELKGLRNRERIWRRCGGILDSIVATRGQTVV